MQRPSRDELRVGDSGIPSQLLKFPFRRCFTECLHMPAVFSKGRVIITPPCHTWGSGDTERGDGVCSKHKCGVYYLQAMLPNSLFLIIIVLEVWSVDQQDQHPLRTC